MLQAIRDKAQGWIAWAIVILISIPFALWGIQEYLGVGGEPEVALVDGEAITERMLDQRTRDFRESMRMSLGDSYRADLFDDSTLKRQVLDAMVEELVLSKNAADWNLRTSDLQARGFIGSVPAFQRDGQFDQLAYETAVRNRGMSRAGFEQNVRQDLALSQLRSAVRDSAFVTESDLEARIGLQEQQRSVSYARVPASAYVEGVSVSQDELRRYYEANLDRYRTPERVKVSYLLLDAAGLGDFADADEQTLRQFFEDHRAEFIAREERAMRHILVAVSAAAPQEDVEHARERAGALLQQLRTGADFASLAKEHSDDPGSADNGGDLGWVERGLMVPPFEQAAFALGKGEVSELVRTDFGFHVIQVTDIRGGSDTGFDELRDQVEAAYRKMEGENLYFDYAERLAESAYENPASLAPAAEALGLQVRGTDWITREQRLAPPLDSPKVLNAVFSDDVLLEGNNSELIEVSQEQAVVVRVAEHEPAGVKPFDANLAQIEADFIKARASETAAQTGERALAELAAGSRTLQQIAAEHGWELRQPVTVGRDQADVPNRVLAKAFGLPPPQAGKAQHAGVESVEGDFFLIEVAQVQDGSLASLSESERSAVSEQAARQAANAELRYLTQSLRERSDVEFKLGGE